MTMGDDFDPFEVVSTGGGARSMDDYFSKKSNKSVNSQSASPRSTAASTTRSARGDHGEGRSRRLPRKAKPAEAGRAEDPSAAAPVAAAPPRRSRRRASIGGVAVLPTPAPEPAAIGSHFASQQKQSSSCSRQEKSFDSSDVQSTQSGYKSKEKPRVRRGRRASLATGRPLGEVAAASANTTSGGFTNFTGFGDSPSRSSAAASNNDFGYEPQFAGGHSNNDHGYGYEDHAPNSSHNKAGPNNNSIKADFGGGAPAKQLRPRRMSIGVPYSKSSGSGGKDLSFAAKQLAPKRTHFGAPAATAAACPQKDQDRRALEAFTSFDLTSNPPPVKSTAAANRTQNIMLPMTAAPAPEKAPRPRRRASLMGNLTGFVTDGSALVGNLTGNITGLVTDRNSERLDGGSKSSSNNSNKNGSFFKDRANGSSNTNKSGGHHHQRAKSSDGGISSYDADRDRRRVFG
jgi:hypothetical protein